MNCLYHLANRKDWRYIGVWERGELGKRFHFHALMYILQKQCWRIRKTQRLQRQAAQIGKEYSEQLFQ